MATVESTSLIVHMRDNNDKKTSKSFTEINSDATYEELTAFGRATAALSARMYDSTVKVTKVQCDISEEEVTNNG